MPRSDVTSTAPAFSADPAVAKTLPSEFYYSEEILSREKERIFFDSWVLVGYDSELSAPGDFLTTKIFDQPILVVRGNDGEIRAFYNACRHRGHMLLEGKGNVKRIRCPYHAWTYKLDGDLRWAPNSENIPSFCADEYPLAAVRVEVFARMVFVNLDANARPMTEVYRGLREEIYGIIPQLDSLHLARRDTIDIDANWKFIFDGLECYHCQFIHPGVMNSKEDYMTRDIVSTEHPRYSTHVFKGNKEIIDGAGGRKKPDWATVVDSYDLNLWYMWPNIMLMSHPGKANLKVAHAWPTAPDRTVRFIDHFLTTPEPTEQDLAQIKRHREVFNQDIAAMLSQQVGVRAKGFRQGRLMVDVDRSWQSEHGTQHFQGLIWDAVGSPR